MECRDVQGFLHAYLDGEFDEQERVAFAAHLSTCPRCREAARLERTLKQTIHRSVPAELDAPAGFEQRVRRALEAAESPPQHWAVRGARWLVPAAAAALLLVGAAVSKRRELGPEPGLAEQSIEWHRQSSIPLDVQGPSPETVRRFFSDKVPFAVRPPTIDRRRAQLMGARLANLREHQAAYLRYRVGGDRVSVFIFDSGSMPPTGLRQKRERAGRTNIRWHQLRGYSVGYFASGGTGYVVTSEMEPDRLVKLIAYPR
jgi:anti-sigma factor (TIGR02949 family)